MMSSRNGRDSLFGARNFPAGSLHQHRRGQSLNGISKDSDENLDLFSRNRRTLSVASSDESSDVSAKLGRLSVGLAKLGKSGIDDLLSSTDGGKNDYDWLLNPPGTPVFPSSEAESQPTLVPPRSSSVRSTSTMKASRLSVSQSENNQPRAAARSSSVTRSSISSSQYSTYSSNRSSSILNTSSASVSSYTRPSSPITRSSSTARPSTPSSSSRPTTSSRPSTPSRARSVSTNSSLDKTKPSQSSSRPSTPGSRPHIPANLHNSPSASSARSLSRPSTPTRRNSVPSLSPSPSTASLNGRNSAPASRPSSPGPRTRVAPQPIVPPDFPLETPPNLRTTLPPDRPVSAGRSRPGVTSSSKGNNETQASNSIPRRQSSPIVTRGRLTEPTGRSRGHANGPHAEVPEPRKVSPDVVTRKSVKASTTASDSSGFGRSISKRSLDMAIRHMDIRSNSGNLRSLSSTTLFPQSIRTSTPKTQSGRRLSAPASVDMNVSPQSSNNGASSDSGNHMKRNMFNGSEGDERQYYAKLSEVDIYESSRYDAILLKEDLKNTNWLHSADDICDQGPIFDNGFESLPEPFGLL